MTEKIVKEEIAKKNKEKLSILPSSMNPQAFPNQVPAGPGYVQTPDGITIIPSNDPNQPPMVIMPDGKNPKNETSSTFYSDSSNHNMMDDYMQNMMMLNMMNQMGQVNQPEEKTEEDYGNDEPYIIPLIGDDDGDMSRRKKKKKKKSKKIGFELRMPQEGEPIQPPLFGGLEEADDSHIQHSIKPIGIDPTTDFIFDDVIIGKNIQTSNPSLFSDLEHFLARFSHFKAFFQI